MQHLLMPEAEKDSKSSQCWLKMLQLTFACCSILMVTLCSQGCSGSSAVDIPYIQGMQGHANEMHAHVDLFQQIVMMVEAPQQVCGSPLCATV